MPKVIDSFKGEYRFLSNFYNYGGVTVEHQFQAAKTDNPSLRASILNAPTPSKARSLGRWVHLKDNWEEVKVEVMRTLLWNKFFYNRELQTALLKTGNAELVEGNTWGDTFWGVCNGEGDNMLGRLLMDVRTGLQHIEREKKAKRDSRKRRLI